MDNLEKLELRRFAAQIRLALLEEIKARGFGHIGGSLSICDLLAVLYGKVMRYRPDDPKWPDRDKLVSSKGHAGPAVYATLALKDSRKQTVACLFDLKVLPKTMTDGYGAWWNVGIAATSEKESVRLAAAEVMEHWEQARKY